MPTLSCQEYLLLCIFVLDPESKQRSIDEETRGSYSREYDVFASVLVGLGEGNHDSEVGTRSDEGAEGGEVL